jgi:plastocyanin
MCAPGHEGDARCLFARRLTRTVILVTGSRDTQICQKQLWRTAMPRSATSSRRKYGVWLAVLLIGFGLPLGVLAQEGLSVSQIRRSFRPGAITLAVGSTLRILNDDTVTHHVYIDQEGMKFDSGVQKIGETVELRFTSTGTFEVQCAVHPQMELTVLVK